MEKLEESNSKLSMNYECSICLNLCVQPVTTPCNHFFCFECEKQVMQSAMSCPMCRSKFDRTWTPAVDSRLQAQIKQRMGKQFEQRELTLRKLGIWVGYKKLIRFTYGNIYHKVKNDQNAIEDSELNH